MPEFHCLITNMEIKMSKIEHFITIVIGIASFVAILVFANYMQNNTPGTINVREQTPCQQELSKWANKLADDPDNDYYGFKVRRLLLTCE